MPEQDQSAEIAALRESEAFYRSLVSVSPYAVTVTDLDGNVIFASEQTCRLHGYERPEDALGRSAFELIAPEEHTRAAANLKRTLQEGSIGPTEYTLLRRDGSTFPAQLSAAVVCDEQGTPKAFIATIADISHIKETERALRDSEARFRELADLAPQIIYEMDAGGRILFASRVGLERFGFEPERFAGGAVSVADLLVAEDRERSRANIGEIMRSRSVGANEYTVVNDRGERVEVAIYSTPIVEDDEVVGLRGVVVDISERKRAEEQLQSLNQELEQRVAQRTAQLEAAVGELESFSYTISHDLRSPLTAIEGYSQALLEDYGEVVGETGRGFIHKVLAANTRMQQLIDDLMRLAGVTRGELAFEQVDLSNFARMVAQRVCQPSEERQLDLQLQDELAVRADARLLQLLLENLIGNAWKFTGHEARPRIEIGALDSSDSRFEHQPGQTVYFVCDNGVGFERERAQTLFQPFQRFHHRDEFPGTGIGLATVQRIVARHGGQVWAESAPGQGTTIYFAM